MGAVQDPCALCNLRLIPRTRGRLRGGPIAWLPGTALMAEHNTPTPSQAKGHRVPSSKVLTSQLGSGSFRPAWPHAVRFQLRYSVGQVLREGN